MLGRMGQQTKFAWDILLDCSTYLQWNACMVAIDSGSEVHGFLRVGASTDLCKTEILVT